MKCIVICVAFAPGEEDGSEHQFGHLRVDFRPRTLRIADTRSHIEPSCAC